MKIALLLIILLSSIAVRAGIVYDRFSGDYEHPTGIFKHRVTGQRIDIPLKREEQPERFTLTTTTAFPCLTVETANFRDQIAEWINTKVLLVPESFRFRGEYEGRGVSICLPYGKKKGVKIELISIYAQPNFEKERLEFESVLVTCPHGEIPGSFNILQALDLESGYKLKIKSKTPLSPSKDLVKIHENTVHEVDVSTIVYERPHLKGIIGAEGPAGEEILDSRPNISPRPYKDSVAAHIGLPSSFQEGPILEFDDEIEDATTIVSSSTMESRSTTERIVESVPVETSLLPVYYKLIPGSLKQIESPYLYSDGAQIFLTQTFEESCHGMVKGKADPTISYRLRYTKATSFPITFESDDPRLQRFLKGGVYKFEKGFLIPLKENFKIENIPSYRLVAHIAGSLAAQEVKNLQRSTHPDTKTVYPYIEELQDFISPDERTVVDNRGYEDLTEQFRREGLLNTIISIPSHKEALILPFLKWVRDLKGIWWTKGKDPDLYRKDTDEHRINGGYSDRSSIWIPVEIPDITFCELLEGSSDKFNHTPPTVLTASFVGLKLLPLLKGNSVDVRFYWPRDSKTRRYSTKVGKGVLGREQWEDLARALRMDQFKKFFFQYHDFMEPESLLSIYPFAEAIRDQTVLEEFAIPAFISLQNLKHLLIHGMGPNLSIKKLMMLNKGHLPFVYIGKMLEENTTLQELDLTMRFICDFECLNLLGDSLAKNSTLSRLSVSISIDPYLDLDAKYFCEACFSIQDHRVLPHQQGQGSCTYFSPPCKRFLPKRSHDIPCTCTDPSNPLNRQRSKPVVSIEHSCCQNLDRFLEGIIKSNLKHFQFQCGHGCPINDTPNLMPTAQATISDFAEKLFAYPKSLRLDLYGGYGDQPWFRKMRYQ